MVSSTIGQYRIDSRLGAGRFTETFRATDLVRRRPVALKLLNPGLLPTEKTYREFLDHIQRASELVHPRIAWVWETGSGSGQYYFAERFIAGETLSACLSNSGPLPWDRALQTLEQLAQAIEFAEEHSWNHGRITPQNILLGADQGAVLSDYGLSQAVRMILPVEPPRLNQAQYLPPEVIQGGPVTPRADLYMLGCTLVEMLTGKPAFEAPDVAEIQAKKTANFDSSFLPPEIVPPQVAEIIERALHPDPARRFDNSLDFVQSLERSIKSGQTDAEAHARHQEQIRRWHEAEELVRQEAVETARNEALEQARREIQDRARLEAELALQLQADIEAEHLQPLQPSRLHRSPRRSRSWLWTLIALAALLILLAGGYRLLNDRSSAGGTLPTASEASAAGKTSVVSPASVASLQVTLSLTSSYTASTKTTSAPGLTPSPTLTSHSSATPHNTSTPVPGPSLTASPTQLMIQSPPPSNTPTRTRPDRD